MASFHSKWMLPLSSSDWIFDSANFRRYCHARLVPTFSQILNSLYLIAFTSGFKLSLIFQWTQHLSLWVTAPGVEIKLTDWSARKFESNFDFFLFSCSTGMNVLKNVCNCQLNKKFVVNWIFVFHVQQFVSRDRLRDYFLSFRS
jgi:hypothetical protein